MAFDPEKDVELKTDSLPNGDSQLQVSVQQYDGGPIKVQIGPRWYKDKKEEWQAGKAGRLSEGEARFLLTFLEEAIEEHYGG